MCVREREMRESERETGIYRSKINIEEKVLQACYRGYLRDTQHTGWCKRQ